jgi:hypothetical protein
MSEEMSVRTKQTIMVAVMVACIAILAIFVYIQLNYQQQLIELLKECDYNQICKTCYNPIKTASAPIQWGG